MAWNWFSPDYFALAVTSTLHPGIPLQVRLPNTLHWHDVNVLPSLAEVFLNRRARSKVKCETDVTAGCGPDTDPVIPAGSIGI
jgi:hypothetical protein